MQVFKRQKYFVYIFLYIISFSSQKYYLGFQKVEGMGAENDPFANLSGYFPTSKKNASHGFFEWSLQIFCSKSWSICSRLCVCFKYTLCQISEFDIIELINCDSLKTMAISKWKFPIREGVKNKKIKIFGIFQMIYMLWNMK